MPTVLDFAGVRGTYDTDGASWRALADGSVAALGGARAEVFAEIDFDAEVFAEIDFDRIRWTCRGSSANDMCIVQQQKFKTIQTGVSDSENTFRPLSTQQRQRP